jgi:hypothetical protein
VSSDVVPSTIWFILALALTTFIVCAYFLYRRLHYYDMRERAAWQYIHDHHMLEDLDRAGT